MIYPSGVDSSLREALIHRGGRSDSQRVTFRNSPLTAKKSQYMVVSTFAPIYAFDHDSVLGTCGFEGDDMEIFFFLQLFLFFSF